MKLESNDVLNEELLLNLIPLVQTAWAHGAIAGKERRIIFEAAREDGIDATSDLNSAIYDLLSNQPSMTFFDKALDKIAGNLREMTVVERDKLKRRILTRCKHVAESAAGNDPMDVRAFVAREEQRTIDSICRRLDIPEQYSDEATFSRVSQGFARPQFS